MTTFDADVIVLGLGAMGSAALYQLARRGVSALGIDRYDPPHKLGSTHGETRITRVACGEGPVYTALARRSHEIWRDIERRRGGPDLLTLNGFLLIAGPDGAAAHGNPDFLGDTRRFARAASVQSQDLTAPEIRARFPAFAVRDDDAAYLDYESGFVRPEACIRAQLDLARDGGASIHVDETVQTFRSTRDGVEVVSDRGTHTAKRLIVTAGPWIPELLGPAYAPLFKIRRQVLYWFALRSEADLEWFRPDRFPVFYWQVPDTQAIYGFPALGGCRDGVKIATEQYVSTTDPAHVARTVTPDETREMFETYIRPYFPGLTRECVRAEVCLYTDVAGARFIIDRHPEMENVIVASPCSGHGFKHSAAVGELLAQMATGEAHGDIGPFAFAAPAADR